MRGKRILVVDDESIVGETIKLTLRTAGHSIEVVTSPYEALSRFEVGKYDVILTDFMMEGLTGAQLAEQIKALDPGQPIIMISGSPPFPAVIAVDLVVLKPFSVSELRKAVVEAAQPRSEIQTIAT